MTQRRDTGRPGAGAGATTRTPADGTWDSALSAGEFAAVEGAGFDPVGQVLGTAVFNIGYTGVWGCPGEWSATYGTGTHGTGAQGTATRATGSHGTGAPSSPWASSYAPLVRTMYAARRLALGRAEAECLARGGDGIVGVTLRVGEFQAGGLEFTALGTAVRARSRIRPARPFTSHLSGQDFARLVHAGWVPTGLAFGIALAIRHDDWRTPGRIVRLAGNQEVDGYTQLVGRVRHDAREQLALDAAKHGGDGVVVDGMELKLRTSECPTPGNTRDLTAEAVLVGTSVARFRRPGRPAGPGPLTIMRLERER
ncbi:heavy metal-binding domain-containing protein [Streptomyces sp. NPDC059378]|uniref:heavy metal-binding domain-containing protein n=1 Tax=Streptomyces sp. NPDC059378 TaxID=3346815 RepID=UPI0036925C3F